MYVVKIQHRKKKESWICSNFSKELKVFVAKLWGQYPKEDLRWPKTLNEIEVLLNVHNIINIYIQTIK